MKNIPPIAAIAAITVSAFACSRHDKDSAASVTKASQSPPLVLPPVPSGDPRAKKECEEPRTCLRRVLPENFDVSQRSLLEQSALGCLGGSIERAWELRECLPFAFARDQRSSELVQVSMTCGDLCPQFANLVFDFVGNPSRFECVCRGFFPLQAPGTGSYTGCTAPPPNAGARYFDIVEPAPGQHVLVQGDPRFEELGFSQGAAVDSIDGVKISATEELSRKLAGIPQHLPGEIRLRRANPVGTKELHYIARDVAEGLARLSAELDLPALAAAHTACLNPDMSTTALNTLVKITFGGARLPSGAPATLFRKLDCTDDSSRRVLRFEEAVLNAAAGAKPREVTSTGSSTACKDAEKVRLFAVARETESVELRYADWARR